MLFDGPARKAEEGYGKYEDRYDDDDDDDDNNDDNDDEHDDYLCLSAVRWIGLSAFLRQFDNCNHFKTNLRQYLMRGVP